MAKRVVETPEEQPPDRGRQAVAVRSGGAAAQDNVRNARLIIGREYRSRVSQRSFRISTIVLLALIVIAARLYRYGVLLYGQKPGLRQLARIMRSK